MSVNTVFSWFATLGPIGYFPASGTVATFITLCMLSLLPSPLDFTYMVMLILCFIAAYMCIQKILTTFVNEDPSEIVIDEVIGCLVTFCCIPLTPITLLVGFILFRLFDICKFGPVGWIEKLPGASGILLDDVVAGLMSNIILRSMSQYGF